MSRPFTVDSPSARCSLRHVESEIVPICESATIFLKCGSSCGKLSRPSCTSQRTLSTMSKVGARERQVARQGMYGAACQAVRHHRNTTKTMLRNCPKCNMTALRVTLRSLESAKRADRTAASEQVQHRNMRLRALALTLLRCLASSKNFRHLSVRDQNTSARGNTQNTGRKGQIQQQTTARSCDRLADCASDRQVRSDAAKLAHLHVRRVNAQVGAAGPDWRSRNAGTR